MNSLYQSFKTAVHIRTYVTRCNTSFIKVGVACVGVHVLKCLKEELVWATDKRLWVISNIILFKTVIPLRN